MQVEIMATMTGSQLAAVREIQLTNVALITFYTEQGLEMPTPNPDALEAEATSLRGRDMTEEERAAKRAEAEASGTSMPESGGGTGNGAAVRESSFAKTP
ncbi:MAG TPA: hypothetical protein G4N98_06930 [Thermoflexia bacterium]|nr:hypothetical protein [Thermoflexia bacterium]